ncbi:sugar O-acetyltransferase [Micromonospora sp. CA-244673]|uniref:sugar O-acetyltransferase n=1 Tax=Micromonospora sp. CA-244673 TaxID=3239958 RepID=UPI003D93DBAD
MRNEQRLRTRTPESRAFAERVHLVMSLTSRLNVLPFDDLDARRTVLTEIFGGPVPESLSVLPPFYCDYGLGASFGERVFINQGCFFLDYGGGGITIADRVLIGPRVTLSTAGHPVELDERYDFITHAPHRHRG